MKLPLTDSFGYIYNWLKWINKDDSIFKTYLGILQLLLIDIGASYFLISEICSKTFKTKTDSNTILMILCGCFMIIAIYVYMAFIYRKRYQVFVNEKKYSGKKARFKALLIYMGAIIYMAIGFFAPCYF